MPAGFPADVPIYTGARLTSAANFASNGQTTWGLEWETFDSVDKVTAFYTGKLDQGDWTVTFSGTANGAFSAVFARKSNSKVGGILGVDGTRALAPGGRGDCFQPLTLARSPRGSGEARPARPLL
jgi:hypothetical protein